MFKFQIYLDDDVSATGKSRNVLARRTERWILLGIPGITLISLLFVAAQNFASEKFLIAISVPVNESIWEHMKLTLYPVTLWWVLYFSVRSDRNKIDAKKWFTSALISLIISLFGIPILYYTYTGSLGIYSEIINILILYIVITVAQLFGLYIYKRTHGWNITIPIFIFLISMICFTYFTFKPPHLPIFRDSVTGEYGVSFTNTNFQ